MASSNLNFIRAARLLTLGIALGSSFSATSGQRAEAPVTSAERYVEFCGAGSAGIAKTPLDCSHALEIGPAEASHVVILLSGLAEGAAMLLPVARYISGAVPDTQVWAVERREQNLADFSEFGTAAALEYYLNGHYRHETPQAAAYARHWGLATSLSDLRIVVGAARGVAGRRVFLGGHSWGATTALAYAAWDFDGHPGYWDLAGLILIDGGVHDSFAGEGFKFRLTVGDTEKMLARINGGDIFTADIAGLWRLPGRPEQVPLFYQLAAQCAVSDPHGPSKLQNLLPQVMQPAVSVSNSALLGWLIDTHAPLADFQAHSGHLDDRTVGAHDWISDGPASIDVIAAAFAGDRPAGLEWYWPRRMSLDLEAIDPFVASAVTKGLGLSLEHASDIDIPLYAFATGITHGSAISAAKWVVANSKIPEATYVTDESMSHLDPLFDAPPDNKFLQTVTSFLTSQQ